MAMLAGGGTDSGVETGNESNDLDVNINATGVNPMGDSGSSSNLCVTASSSGASSELSNQIGFIGGSRSRGDKDNDVPPPPPPTSPNICGTGVGPSDFTDSLDGMQGDRDVIDEDADCEADHDGSDDVTEEMDRDFNDDEENGDQRSFSSSPPLNTFLDSESGDECYPFGRFGPAFQFNLSATMDSTSFPDTHMFSGSSSQCSFHPHSMFSSPPAPPATPTNLNTCRSLIKFEFPELPKLVCQFVEPPAGLRSFLSIEQYQADSSTQGYNAVEGSNPAGCRALIPYEQHDLRQKVRTHTRTIRNKLYDNWSNMRKDFNETRLRTAAGAGNSQIVSKLISGGLNPNAADKLGRTALHIAACKGYSEVVRLLLHAGANPNQKDSMGNTPLHLAACTNHFDVVTCLLRAGTDVSTLDNNGRNPLQLAQSKLKMLATGKSESGDSIRVKMEVQQIIEMMLEYLQKKGQDVEAELLNAFASRLTLSQTREEVDADVKNLLANLSSLSITPVNSVGRGSGNRIQPPKNPYLTPNFNPSLAKPRVVSSLSTLASSSLPSTSSNLPPPISANYMFSSFANRYERDKALINERAASNK